MNAKRKRDVSQTSDRQTSEVLKTSEVSDIHPAPYDLPDGWTVGKLGDLIYIAARIGWRGLKAEEYTQGGPLFLSVHNLNKGEHVDFSGAFHISEARYNESPEIQLRENDILLVKDGAGIGKIGIVKGLAEKATVNSSLLVIRVGDVFVPEFLFYFLKGPVMQEVVKQKITGSATPHVFQRDIKKFELLIPPLPEQRRIVAKIEQLFAESRTARDAQGRVPALLKRFRQSVLAAAFRGQLTERDPNDEPASALLERIRAQRTQRLPKSSRLRKSETRESEDTPAPPPPDTSALPELPEGWVRVRIGEIAEVRLGRQRSPSRATGPNMRPYMRAANVTWNGLDLSDVKEMDFSLAEQKVYRLKRGDVLLAEASGSVSEVGKPVVWNEEIEECYFQNTLIRVRSENAVPKYLYFHFLYDALTARFSEIAQGIGINHLGANGLSGWVISLAPLSEQRRIVARIEALFAQADAVERAVAIARQRADKVDQAILSRAFRGVL